MDHLHATSNKMGIVREDHKEKRRPQPMCSTPKRSTDARKCRSSHINRSCSRFSGPRSPGMSPVSLATSLERDEFSDMDDFNVDSTRKQNIHKHSRIHGNRSGYLEDKRNSRENKHETFLSKLHEVERKQALSKWGVSQSQKKVQYEPLVIVSDEEEFTGIKKHTLTRKYHVKKAAGINHAMSRHLVIDEGPVGKHINLHNPTGRQGLSLRKEENSTSSKEDLQHPIPLNHRIVRKRTAESSSHYLRKKVLTMRLGKSFAQQSLIENEEQLVTSTPVKPSSRILLSSSTKEPDSEIVIHGNASNGESVAVRNSLAKKISNDIEEDSEKDTVMENFEENQLMMVNEGPSEGDAADKKLPKVKHTEKKPQKEINLSDSFMESTSGGKENVIFLSHKNQSNPSKHNDNFNVNKVLSEWPVDEICATSNEKLKQVPVTQDKVKAVLHGKEQEIEAFVEYSHIKFRKHKKQNIQYGMAVNKPGYGSGFVHLTPGSDKGLAVAKQCNFIYVVLDGVIEVKTLNVERICKPGDTIIIPKGTKYNIIGRGDKVAALVYFQCQVTDMI